MSASGTPHRRAIYGKLAGDSTLTGLLATPVSGFTQAIYFEGAPDEAQFPYVIFSKSSGTPINTFKQGSALFDSDLWTIKGVDQNQTADRVEGISARLEALLTDANISIAGRTLMYLRRESDLDYLEVHEGVLYRHSGSVFRLTSA